MRQVEVYKRLNLQQRQQIARKVLIDALVDIKFKKSKV